MKGHLHPMTQFMNLSIRYFTDRGFLIAEGPEVETEWYNFDALNMFKDHPARDMQDTFWIKGEKKVLRTQTTTVDVKYVKERGLKPPFKLIVPGRIFRREATDMVHEHTFYQIDGIAVGKEMNLGYLIGILDGYMKEIYGEDIKTRFRPGYFPFVEPGMEMDILINQKSKIKNQKWMEMLGAGMAHPQVLRNMNIDPDQWTGIMWGMGLDRYMMQYFGVDDIRLSYSGDLRFLKQF
jgi:phenylalanyl-tRNA synthetase alpha chain